MPSVNMTKPSMIYPNVSDKMESLVHSQPCQCIHISSQRLKHNDVVKALNLKCLNVQLHLHSYYKIQSLSHT